MIDLGLSGHVLQNTTQIFSAPEHISDGQAWGVDDLVTYLQRTGYRPDADENALGTYTIQGNTLDIRPSKLSFFAGGNALAVQFNGTVIRTIRPLARRAHIRVPAPSLCRLRGPTFSRPTAPGRENSPRPCFPSNWNSASASSAFSRCTRTKSTWAIAAALAFADSRKPVKPISARICAS